MNKRRIILSSLLAIFVSLIFSLNTQPTYASTCNSSFLGFQAWYSGVEFTNDNCQGTIKSDAYKGNNIYKLIWTIVLNVMMDISIAVGLLATGFVVYGGYLYILSNGESGRVAKGKTTIRNAVIGIVIALTAGMIVGFAKMILSS